MTSPFRKFYNWAVKQADGPYAATILFLIAFAESSFFPLPPDLLLLPMVLANPKHAYRFALICTVGSVLGGLVGYAIGAFFLATLGQWIIDTYNLAEAFTRFHDGFNEWGIWIIIAKGLTPIPYKLVTIASGVAGLNLIAFTLASIATRGFRFYLLSFLLKKFGPPIEHFVHKHLTWVMLGILAIIVLGFWLVLG